MSNIEYILDDSMPCFDLIYLHNGGLKRLVAHRPRLVYYVVYYPLAANNINSYWKIAEKFKDKYEVFGGLL